ncbi:nucleoside phosphorylase domain-containing protein [Nemania sp. FL0916]|nr:nucleoside phosphorylase domain-containing protein [Nemania sp. FL0916]
MSKPGQTYGDYTVGWVCALPKERAAAMAMLDESHDGLPSKQGDNNVYSLGSIGGHNVVIAGLPKGMIGTTSAAVVATDMVRTFPSVRFGLMVGIGGGIPPDVQLGDIVVSTPIGTYPGVVQWDFGKQEKQGRFVRTGSLDKPPRLLLTAAETLEAKHMMMNKPKIDEYLNDMVKRYPAMGPKFLRNDSFKDVRFEDDYEHRDSPEGGEGGGGKGGDNSCQYCDKTKVVEREPKGRLIYYGLIASGNMVVKDAAFRNQLSKFLNNQVLCVEIEAASLMDNFPCIVIRGICNYADSYKNKIW